MSGDRKGFEIFSRRVGPGTWYPQLYVQFKAKKKVDGWIRTSGGAFVS